jgi:hypothetical protein
MNSRLEIVKNVLRDSFANFVQASGSISNDDGVAVLSWLIWASENDLENVYSVGGVGRFTLDEIVYCIWG